MTDLNDFSSIFYEAEEGSTTKASNMVANVSIAYNAADASQRNAVLQAQTKISKAQKRKESDDTRKKKFGINTENSMKHSMDEFTSIFL